MILTLVLTQKQAYADTTYPLANDAAVRQAMDRFYNLDYDGAQQRFETILKAHPNDPMVLGLLLTVVEFRELYNQDLLDTTYYARENFLSSNRKVQINPAVRQRIEALTNSVINICDKRIDNNKRDKDCYFARSYAKGIHAAFMTLADHSFAGAAKQGLQSRSDAEDALKIDPNYTDAKMAVGIQQFAVASLPRWLRFIVGIVGVGGSKEKGLALLRDCSEHCTLTKVESMTAMSLFLRHDGRYNDAIVVSKRLAAMYPHNYLYRLEVANLTKDAGHGPQAIAEYRAVLADANKHGYFIDPRLALAHFGLAETERGQNDIQSALNDYLAAAKQPNCSDWMRKRAQLNAGMMFDLLHKRNEAITQYRLAAAPGGDQSQADDARKYIRKSYTGH
ncbi:MAG: hypothetical protein JSS87_13950 [Acidobacteria bacterium]|nr:hypothetical protein [Acidobacteriota bacterium]